jgi:hypothetical protein
MLIAWTCLFLNDYIFFQVLILYLASLWNVIYFITVKPIKEIKIHFLELYNELTIMLCLQLAISLNNVYHTETETKSTIGVTFVNVIVLLIFVHLTYMVS